jgi:hypothetical protein
MCYLFLTPILVGSQGGGYVKLAGDAMASVAIAGESGAFLVDFLPACALPHPQCRP